MKKIQFWSLLLGLTFGSLAFVACGDDDDDSPSNSTPPSETPDDPTPPANEITGTWRVDVYVTDQDKAQGNYESDELQFNEDGSFKETLKGGNFPSSCEGSWEKGSNGKVKVKINKKFNYNWNTQQFDEVDENFSAVDTTFSYTFKDNVLLAESYLLNGYMLYTRDGKVSTKGFGNYAGQAIVGAWRVQEWGWNGWMTTEAEFTADGLCYDQTYDENGWGEGFGGYYFIEGDQILCIQIFGTLYNNETKSWEFARPWLREGGHWQKIDIRNNNNVLYTVVGHFDFANTGLKKVGTVGEGDISGFWENRQMRWNDSYTNQYLAGIEHWMLGKDNVCSHWQIERYSESEKFNPVQGRAKTGTYTVDNGQSIIKVVWTNELRQVNDSTFTVGDEIFERDTVVYQYKYSPYADMLVIWWDNAQYGTSFSRMK